MAPQAPHSPPHHPRAPPGGPPANGVSPSPIPLPTTRGLPLLPELIGLLISGPPAHQTGPRPGHAAGGGSRPPSCVQGGCKGWTPAAPCALCLTLRAPPWAPHCYSRLTLWNTVGHFLDSGCRLPVGPPNSGTPGHLWRGMAGVKAPPHQESPGPRLGRQEGHGTRGDTPPRGALAAAPPCPPASWPLRHAGAVVAPIPATPTVPHAGDSIPGRSPHGPRGGTQRLLAPPPPQPPAPG